MRGYGYPLTCPNPAGIGGVSSLRPALAGAGQPDVAVTGCPASIRLLSPGRRGPLRYGASGWSGVLAGESGLGAPAT